MNKFSKTIWGLSTFFPLFLIFGFIFIFDKNNFFQIIGIITLTITVLIIVLFYKILFLAKKKLKPSELKVDKVKSSDSFVLSNTVMYILPFVLFSNSNESINLLVFLVMLATVVGLSLLSRNLMVNPLIYVVGYRYYEIHCESGVTYTLITNRKRVKGKSNIVVIELFEELYLEIEVD